MTTATAQPRTVEEQVEYLSATYPEWVRPDDLGVSSLHKFLVTWAQPAPLTVVSALAARWKAERQQNQHSE